jgi:tRNA pseudouridine38-40 synthase
MRNIKLTLEYDGTHFVGWQTQANGRSVQEEVSKVLRQVLQERITLHGAGRTDSGVHAHGQVANFLTTSTFDVHPLLSALNGNLPDDVCILSIEEVPERFRARHDAKSRVYKYYVSLAPIAIDRRYRWYVKYSLDVDLMNMIAASIIGERDFESFCKYASDVDHYRCTVMKSEWTPLPGGLVYEIRANRFLHGMVRALVGTMVDMGRRHTPAASFPDIMAAKDRTRAGMAAPAHGLYLEEVIY